jgi:CheY-like chemotaxis protein
LENLREELDATVRERDAARQALELLHIERVTHARELQEMRREMAAAVPPAAPAPTAAQPAAPEASAPTAVLVSPPAPTFATSSASFSTLPTSTDATTTQRVMLPPPAEFQPVASALPLVHNALERFGTDPNALKALSAAVDSLAGAAIRLGDHPICRLTMSMETLLQDLASRSEPPGAAHLRTMTQAADLIARLLDPRCLERAKTLPHPKVLAVDDDTDLLHTLAASLELAQLPTTTCADSHKAQILLEKNSFDLLLLDVGLPDLDGPSLCNRIREIEGHRNTPVIFLTGTNTLDQRAQASLSGGNDFLAKPFNMAELTVKAETWIWKNQLGLM